MNESSQAPGLAITLTGLSFEDVNRILKDLQEYPFKEVSGLISRIQMEAQFQINEYERRKAEAENPTDAERPAPVVEDMPTPVDIPADVQVSDEKELPGKKK